MLPNLEEAAKKLRERSKLLQEILRNGLGETAAPGYWERCATADATRTPLLEEFGRQLYGEQSAFAEAVLYELEKLEPWDKGVPLTRDKVWLWGGPTPE